jgi:choline transport protein
MREYCPNLSPLNHADSKPTSSTHIAEEMPNPSRNLPRVMCLTMIIGTLTGFLWAFAFMFSATDLEEVAAAKLPVLTLYSQALHNDSVAVFFVVWLALVYCGGAITGLVAAGRQTWAFARDNGLPYSERFARIHPRLQTPVNATILTGAFCVVYGAIYVGSTTAFNSFISLAILGLNASYTIPQAIVLFRGRASVLPKRPFDLGPVVGPLCNAFSIAWVALYTVLFCFPVVLPVTLDSMNYLSVVVAGVGAFILILWWGGKRKTFIGPMEVIDSVGLTPVPSNASNPGGHELGSGSKSKV